LIRDALRARPRRKLNGMRDRGAASLESIIRAKMRTVRSDARREHSRDDCAHLMGVGVEVSRWLSHPKSGAILCECECHSSCSITGSGEAVAFRTWRESCSCAGAEQERQRLEGVEFPGF
jgi:hypothetical protein